MKRVLGKHKDELDIMEERIFWAFNLVSCPVCGIVNKPTDLVKARYDEVFICEDCKRDGN